MAMYNVSDYGALPNARQSSTNGIQAAIDAAAWAGGGTVFGVR
ncbi:hypothetical protein [Saccharibacillus sacchari]|uniref:Uncharacterized protein n=1 Tax=Saccharibacillus sacchari TaxID=456493 RepID=A0ACC6PCV3_9BACL